MFSVNGVSWLRNAGLKRYIEVGLLAASILLAGTLVFGSTHMGRLNIPTLSYMPLPLLLWASLRFGAAGLSASLLGITLISTGYAVQGRGLFTSPSMITNVLSLQVLLCMITLPLMFLVAVLAERRITEQSLRESRVRLIDAQEQERHRIARELHDDVGQKLALLESELAQLGDESQMPRRPRLHELVDQVSDISKVTREISHGLRPSHLEHLGLIIAIRKLCRDFAQDSSLNINCTEVNVPEPLAFDISLSLYRIAQEALHNIEKHSHARSVSIELRGNARRLLLRIIDDGIGFDANSKRAEGLGIANMQERIASVSGTFVIASAPMKGTRIEVRVPIVPTG
jgi:two-component system sensor histidine kinase UhpB